MAKLRGFLVLIAAIAAAQAGFRTAAAQDLIARPPGAIPQAAPSPELAQPVPPPAVPPAASVPAQAPPAATAAPAPPGPPPLAAGAPTPPEAPVAAPEGPAAPTDAAAPAAPVAAVPPIDPSLRIAWEVSNRFRLFKREADFRRHLAADRGDGVLAAEDRLEQASDGRGWAADMVGHLCLDRAGRLLESCERDGESENYLSPQDHRISVVLAGAVPVGAICAWSFADGVGAPQQVTTPCQEPIRLRVRSGPTTVATVDVTPPGEAPRRAQAEIAVRDVLIAGMGDSIAAGEGNPDRPVSLDDGGFCFRRFLHGSPSEYFRPGRAGFSGDKSCAPAPGQNPTAEWNRHGAQWMSAACHASLYGYQMRTALALAVENAHLAVTFLPLACSGATIAEGLFGPQAARECPPDGTRCRSSVPGQIGELRALLTRARKQQPDRQLDLLLLTIGANDILFSSLVADVIVDASTERTLFGIGGVRASVADAQGILDKKLPGDFARLRAALKPLVGGDLARVAFVTYGDPALSAPGTPCPGGRDGFDVHPAFKADPTRLAAVSQFVSNRFLPRIAQLARCEGGTLCKNREADAMTLIDGHQPEFARHGFCMRADTDPAFDRDCISPTGESFTSDPAKAAEDPMACGQPASEYRPYAPRARWIRTADDSYFTAMTYPLGLSPTMQPSDIHDATWGVLSAVYGGAVHPTAEGHAAMADAVLPAVRTLLGLKAPNAILSEPLPAPEAPSAEAPSPPLPAGVPAPDVATERPPAAPPPSVVTR